MGKGAAPAEQGCSLIDSTASSRGNALLAAGGVSSTVEPVLQSNGRKVWFFDLVLFWATKSRILMAQYRDLFFWPLQGGFLSELVTQFVSVATPQGVVSPQGFAMSCPPKLPGTEIGQQYTPLHIA